jgi:Ca-activated chloride channel family protein
MARLFRKIEQPQVTNVNIQWPNGSVVDAYPAIVPDLYSGEPVVIKARLDRKPRAGDEVIVGGDAVLGAWQAIMPLDTIKDSAGIAALWARARIAELENRRRRGEDAEQIRAEIVTTAISHHLVSRYTSLIAVDKTPVRPASEMLGKDQVPNLLPHGQSQLAIPGFTATATSAPLSRLLGAMFLMLAMFVWLSQIMRPDHALPARA